MDAEEDRPYLAATRAWLDTVVIGLALCPFARHEVDSGALACTVVHEADAAACLRSLMDECDRLDSEPGIGTSLLVYSRAFVGFDDYLEFLALANALLAAQGYDGVYQLASFHPDYRFDGAASDDAANYTNRSPYPMLHLLREDSLARALAGYPDPEQIPVRNMRLTRKLGLAAMRALLAACRR